MGVTDDIWHHVCVVWEGESRLLATFKDGERNYQPTEFRAGSLNVGSVGIENFRLFYVGGFFRLLFILTLILEVK